MFNFINRNQKSIIAASFISVSLLSDTNHMANAADNMDDIDNGQIHCKRQDAINDEMIRQARSEIFPGAELRNIEPIVNFWSNWWIMNYLRNGVRIAPNLPRW